MICMIFYIYFQQLIFNFGANIRCWQRHSFSKNSYSIGNCFMPRPYQKRIVKPQPDGSLLVYHSRQPWNMKKVDSLSEAKSFLDQEHKAWKRRHTPPRCIKKQFQSVRCIFLMTYSLNLLTDSKCLITLAGCVQSRWCTHSLPSKDCPHCARNGEQPSNLLTP